MVVAATNGIGALRLVQSAMGERAEGRGEVAGEGERGQGSLGVSRREGEAEGGKQELEPAACASALSRRQQQLWGEGRKTTGSRGGLGQKCWAAQGLSQPGRSR